MSAKFVMLAALCAISAKFVQPLPVQRSMLKPSSLFELSVHDNWAEVGDPATAFRFVGAFGTGGGVGVGVGGGGVGVTVGVGVGVGVGLPPHVGKRNDPMRVRQLKLVVVV